MKTEWIQLETEGDNMILRKLSKNPDKLTWPSKGFAWITSGHTFLQVHPEQSGGRCTKGNCWSKYQHMTSN